MKMERATKRDKGGNPLVNCDFCKTENGPDYCGLLKCRNRLISKLAAYEDAEEQRRLAVLPFPIGTQIWSAEPFKDRKPRCAEVTVFEVDENGAYGFWCGFDPEPMSAEFLVEDIGKTVFFSREKAEKAVEVDK